MHPQYCRKYSVIITLWQSESLFSIRTAILKLSWSKNLFFTLITAILNFYLEQTSNYISNFLTFMYLLIFKKRYSSSKLKIKGLGIYLGGYRGGSTPKPHQSILKDLLILKTIRLFKNWLLGDLSRWDGIPKLCQNIFPRISYIEMTNDVKVYLTTS